MSETILKILLSELKTLRIVCKCGAVSEVGIKSLAREKDKERALNCPGCGIELRPGRAGPDQGPPADGLDSLAEAWGKLLPGMANVARIEFVMLVKEGE